MTAALTIDDPAYFDRLAEVEETHWWSLGMWRLAANWLGAELRGRSGLAALDIGCGTGLTMLRLSRRPEIDTVVGVDPSPEALDHARRRHSFPLLRASALEIPFEDERFDVVSCFDVLQHLPPGADRRALSEMTRILRPGGVAVIRSNARPESSSAPEDACCYRLSDLRSLVEGSGLRLRRACYANCVPALAQEVRGSLGRLGRGSTPRHPAGGGLRIRRPPPWINRLMFAVSSAEAVVAGPFGLPLPFGHSTMALAQKAGKPKSLINGLILRS